MSTDTQIITQPQTTYYVMNMRNDKWIKISKSFASLDEARQVYIDLLRNYPFARLGGSAIQDN